MALIEVSSQARVNSERNDDETAVVDSQEVATRLKVFMTEVHWEQMALRFTQLPQQQIDLNLYETQKLLR